MSDEAESKRDWLGHMARLEAMSEEDAAIELLADDIPTLCMVLQAWIDNPGNIRGDGVLLRPKEIARALWPIMARMDGDAGRFTDSRVQPGGLQ